MIKYFFYVYSGRHIPEPYTPPYVSYIPEIRHVSLNKNDKFLILATDGVWDFLSDQEAVDLVAKCKDRSQAAARLVDKALEVAAAEAGMTIQDLRALPVGSKRRSRHDDTTVVVMYLNE